MTGNIQDATTALGGLALFIYGMGLMSDGLTQVAGARMKAILGVKVPQTRAIVKSHWAECSDADVDALITSPYHEARLAGLLVLCRRYKAAKGDSVCLRRIPFGVAEPAGRLSWVLTSFG